MPTNPLIADPMYWKGYIEKVGTGTEDIIEKCRDYGLKTPEFYQEEDFRVVIWRAAEERQSDPKRSKDDPKEVEDLIGLIKNNPSISRAELARQLDLSERQVRKMMDQLRADERLTRKGGLNSSYKCNGIHINNLFKFFVWCEVSKSFTRSII